MEITYGFLIQFSESYISDYVTYDIDVNDVEEMDLHDHAQVCVEQLNYYCNQKQEQGTLLKFDCEGTDLTKAMNEILIKH